MEQTFNISCLGKAKHVGEIKLTAEPHINITY